MTTSASEREDIIARNIAAVDVHFHNENADSIDRAVGAYTDDIVWEVQARGLVHRDQETVKQDLRVHSHRGRLPERAGRARHPGQRPSGARIPVPRREDLPGERLRDLAPRRRRAQGRRRHPRRRPQRGLRMTVAVIGATGTRHGKPTWQFPALSPRDRGDRPYAS
jgi:hypothetical protein